MLDQEIKFQLADADKGVRKSKLFTPVRPIWLHSKVSDALHCIGLDRYNETTPFSQEYAFLRRYEGRLVGNDATTARATTARICGYIRQLPSCRVLNRVVKAGSQGSGYGSCYQVANISQIIRATRSPGRGERIIRAIRARAKAILAPYGVAPSNLALCRVMSAWKGGRARVGKAAFKVAKETLNLSLGNIFSCPYGSRGTNVLQACRGLKKWHKLFKMGESARGWLVYYAVQDGRVASFEEGLELDIQPCLEGGLVGAIETAPIHTKAGATVHRFCQAGAFAVGKSRIVPETFVRLGRMTYHGAYAYAPAEYTLRQALQAFRARKIDEELLNAQVDRPANKASGATFTVAGLRAGAT